MDLPFQKTASYTRIINNSENTVADIEYICEKNRLYVQAVTGIDPVADTNLTILNSGNPGDTIEINIPSDSISVTTIVQVSDTPLVLTNRIISNLNGDINFSNKYIALGVSDNPKLFISSLLYGSEGERTEDNSVIVNITGSIEYCLCDDKILRRCKPIALGKTINDPGVTTLKVSGDLLTEPGELGELVNNFALNGGSKALNVDGSITPIEFTIDAHPTKNKYITELRLFGLALSIKFEQFLSISTLTNGIIIEIKSNDKIVQFPIIKDTEHIIDYFSNINNSFILQGVGKDKISSARLFPNPFILKKQGTSLVDDYVKVIIRDNLSSITNLEFLSFGFLKEE